MWCIYKHTNKINGKVYIGQTCQRPEDRWQNGNGYRGSPKFWSAIQKYQWENFTHEIIEVNIQTKEEANIREQYWINFYDSYYRGYNATPGGDTNEHLFKPVYKINLNYEIIERFPNIASAELACDTTSISGCCHRQYRTAGGFFWCFCEDWSENWQPIEDFANKTAIYQISMQDYSIVNKYDSILSASRAMSNNPKTNSISNIQGCLTGKGISAYGYYWCKVEDWSLDWKPRERIIPNAHTVVCWDTGELFDSPIKVKEKYGILVPNVIACCTGKNISAKGLHFCYLEDYENGWQPRKTKREKKVICLETLEIFNSGSDADRAFGVSIGSVSKVCTGYRGAKTVKGKHFCFLSEWTLDMLKVKA